MKATKAIRFANVAMAAVAGLLLTLPLQAQIKSHSGNLIVEQPANLPEMAQTPGQALFLYQVRDGETYLTSSNTMAHSLPSSMSQIPQKSREWLRFQSRRPEHSSLYAI
jgi:hypothetical protein